MYATYCVYSKYCTHSTQYTCLPILRRYLFYDAIRVYLFYDATCCALHPRFLCMDSLIFLAIQNGMVSHIRVKQTGKVPQLTLEQGHRFHLFLSHTWSSGQDQCAVMKRQLCRMMPLVRVFLDVDDLDDINNLDEHIARSSVILLFISKVK